MGTIPNIKEYFDYDVGDARRMLTVYFGGREAELRPPGGAFLACRLELTENLSTPFRAVVHGLTPDFWRYPHADVPGDRDVEPHPDRFLGLPTAITLRAEGRTRSIHGVVTSARHLGNWFSETEHAGYDAFELVVEAPLRLLDLRRASRVYQERTTLQILHELLDEHRFLNVVADDTLRANFPNERNEYHLARACRTQYQESDLDFIQRLLIDEGLNYVLEAERGKSGFGNAWQVFGADHNFGKVLDATLSTEPEPGELELLNWHGRRQLVPAYTYAVSHDYKDNARYEGKGRGRENTGMGKAARGLFGSYESLSPRAVRDPSSEMRGPASHRQWAHDMDAEVYDGETTAPLTLAKPIRVVGLETARTPLRTSAEANERDDDYIVTAQTIVATAPLRPEMRQRWDSLATEVRARTGVELFAVDDDDTRPLQVRFQAHPRATRIVPPHPRPARRPTPGAMTATVVGGEGAVVETDKLGRIAVRFHWEREPDVPQFAVNFPQFPRPPTRVRYVHPGAGQGVGMQYLPRVGDEVLILFIDNDPDRPIAVGSVHNGVLGTPTFGGVANLPKDAALTGLRTGEHKGAGANEMVFDDTTGEVGLRLGSTTAATDLSLGNIATPRQGGNATTRGSGAELRTDGAAALRAAQGILMSTYVAAKDAPHLQHDDLTSLLERCRELTQSLSEAIARAGGTAPAVDGQGAIQESLSSWSRPSTASDPGPEGTEAIVAVQSRKGIAIATDTSQVLFAGDDMHAVAGGRTQHTSGSTFNLTSGRRLTLFALDDGIDAIASKGNLHLQAQHDGIVAEARSGVTVSASEGRVQITGLEIELIAHDGSFLRIGNGIELGTNENVLIHAKHVTRDAPQTLSTNRKAPEGHDTDQRFRVRFTNDAEGPRSAGARHVQAVADDGTVHEGETSTDGLTDTIADTLTRTLRAHVLDHPL